MLKTKLNYWTKWKHHTPGIWESIQPFQQCNIASVTMSWTVKYYSQYSYVHYVQGGLLIIMLQVSTIPIRGFQYSSWSSFYAGWPEFEYRWSRNFLALYFRWLTQFEHLIHSSCGLINDQWRIHERSSSVDVWLCGN